MKFVAVLLLLAGSLAPAQYEDRTEWRVNQARIEHDVARLPHGRCVARFAGAWAEYLATTGQLYHQDLRAPVRRCRGKAVAEILLGGPVGPRQAVTLWLASDAHRHFLLSGRYDHMAAGAAQATDGAWVVSVVFIEH